MSPPPKKSPAKRPPARQRRGKTAAPPAERAARRTDSGWRRWLLAAGERRWVESLGWWIAIAALVVPPLVLLGWLRDPFRLPKALLTELLVPGSLIFLAFALRRVERVDWRQVIALPAVRALLPLWLVAMVSALLSDHPGHAAEALWSFGIGALAVVAWSVGLPRKRRALDLLLIPAAVLAAVAVLQHHEIFRPFEFVRDTRRTHLASLAGNVADLGAYLVLPLLIAQAGVVRAFAMRHWRWLAAATASLALMLYAVLIGQTLSAFAALFVSTTVFWLLRVSGRLRWALIGGALTVGVLGLILVAPARHRVAIKLRQVQQGELNDVLTGRLDGWRAGMDMAASHPVLGVGPGGYRAEFSDTKLALIDDGVEFWWGHDDGSLFGNAHNELVELVAELGALGLLALGICGWVVLGELRRRPWPSPAQQSTAEGPDGAPRLDATPGEEPGGAVGGAPPAAADPARSAVPAGSALHQDLVAADRRALQWAGLAALAVLSTTYFPLRTALVAYPYVLLLAWILEPAPLATRTVGRQAAGEAALPAEAAA